MHEHSRECAAELIHIGSHGMPAAFAVGKGHDAVYIRWERVVLEAARDDLRGVGRAIAGCYHGDVVARAHAPILAPVTEKLRPVFTGLIMLLLAALVVGTFVLTAYLSGHNQYGDQQLTLLLIGGLVTFLVTLSVLVLLFKTWGLSDPRYALGLPEGSIRAILALALLLLFAILVLTIYFSENYTGDQTDPIEGITATQLAAIPVEQLQSSTRNPKDGTFTVRLLKQPNQSSRDLARQVVTTVSTLVIAISSFYFGSTVVAAATGNEGSTGAPANRRDGKTSGEASNENSD